MADLLGLTGTRWIDAYRDKLWSWLNLADTKRWFEHFDGYVTGGCFGWDAFAGRFLADTWPDKEHWVIVPANLSQVDAWWLEPGYEFVRVVYMPMGTDYRDRNTVIVERSVELHFCAERPEADGKSKRSGTWMTVRIARKADIPTQGVILQQQEEKV